MRRNSVCHGKDLDILVGIIKARPRYVKLRSKLYIVYRRECSTFDLHVGDLCPILRIIDFAALAHLVGYTIEDILHHIPFEVHHLCRTRAGRWVFKRGKGHLYLIFHECPLYNHL